MSLILNIDTSTETAGICLVENGMVVDAVTNTDQKDHAAFLHNAINDILQKKALELKSLDAIAVVNGPGSYTGLRVGMASAKGLCYALDKPFITVGSLNVLAYAAISTDMHHDESSLYCPMIDARRMEVFTALFDNKMNEVLVPAAMILNETSFKDRLETNRICFIGNGARKFEAILSDKNAFFAPHQNLMLALGKLSFEKFLKKNFTHLVDSEPLYIKDFYISPDLHNKK